MNYKKILCNDKLELVIQVREKRRKKSFLSIAKERCPIFLPSSNAKCLQKYRLGTIIPELSALRLYIVLS